MGSKTPIGFHAHRATYQIVKVDVRSMNGTATGRRDLLKAYRSAKSLGGPLHHTKLRRGLRTDALLATCFVELRGSEEDLFNRYPTPFDIPVASDMHLRAERCRMSPIRRAGPNVLPPTRRFHRATCVALRAGIVCRFQAASSRISRTCEGPSIRRGLRGTQGVAMA